MNKLDIIKANAKHFDNVYIKPKYVDINCDSESIILDYLIMKAYTDKDTDILILTETNYNLVDSYDSFKQLKNYMKASFDILDKNIKYTEKFSGEMLIEFNNGYNLLHIVGVDTEFNGNYNLIYLRNCVSDMVDYSDVGKHIRDNGRIITNDTII